jgi:glutamate synthase domain-containing protein 3
LSSLDFLRTTIERHVAFTDSAVGRRILGEWDAAVAKFAKVMPTDYRRVLDVIARATASGLTEEQTVDEIMEAARA